MGENEEFVYIFSLFGYLVIRKTSRSPGNNIFRIPEVIKNRKQLYVYMFGFESAVTPTNSANFTQCRGWGRTFPFWMLDA
jgi:hypothetical protein